MPGFTSYSFVVEKLRVPAGERNEHEVKNLDIWFRRKSKILKNVNAGKYTNRLFVKKKNKKKQRMLNELVGPLTS